LRTLKNCFKKKGLRLTVFYFRKASGSVLYRLVFSDGGAGGEIDLRKGVTTTLDKKLASGVLYGELYE
jgi:hypothetical protein